MRNFWIYMCVNAVPAFAWAQLDRGGNVLHEDDGGGSGSNDSLPDILGGAVVWGLVSWGVYSYLEKNTSNSSAANGNIAFFAGMGVIMLMVLVSK